MVRVPLFVVLCLFLVPGFGLQEQQSKEFLFLLDKIGKLEEKVTSLEKSNLQKDVNVNLDLAESHCESGKVQYVNSFGERTVTFARAFTKIPAVSIGFKTLDSIHSKNMRVNCDHKSISTTGFTMACKTWADTVLYQVGVSWMAC